MKMVFLRGAVPPANEHPERLQYGVIGECEDMWTQLFYELLKEMDSEGELLYQGSPMTKVLGGFTEKHVPSFADYSPSWEPDVIICRGGFPYYDPFLKRYPKAKKVYYGAGERYFPVTDFKDYDLFLVDSKSQWEDVQKKTKARISLFIKPAASMFTPKDEQKVYDVCFVADGRQSAFKGHRQVIEAVANTGLRVLNIGTIDRKMAVLSTKAGAKITWAGWMRRHQIPRLMSACKIGICCSIRKDSCPRVIPEYLACGLPIVITSDVQFWIERYITSQTGIVVPSNRLVEGIKETLSNISTLSPRAFYERELSTKRAVECFELQLMSIL